MLLSRSVIPRILCAPNYLFHHYYSTTHKTSLPSYREYFYHVDVHGQLFLHDTIPKNFTTCFKSKPFLDFFFSRIRLNTVEAYIYEYPFVSPCGRELNFISVEDITPISFHELTKDGFLTWAGTLKILFEPETLTLSEGTGRVYHKSPIPLPPHHLGLIKSSLLVGEMANMIDLENKVVEWRGKKVPIKIVK